MSGTSSSNPSSSNSSSSSDESSSSSGGSDKLVVAKTGSKSGSTSQSGSGQSESKGSFSSEEGKPTGVFWKEASWLSEKEKTIIKLINIARKKPETFAEKVLKPMKGTHFIKSGEVWKPDYDLTDQYMPIRTLEHLDGFQKAIEYVEKQPKMRGVRVSQGLCLACQDLLAEQSVNGAKGHLGEDASGFRDRATRYGTVEGNFLNESLVYGHDGAPENVAFMIWNDGKKSRPDRGFMFHPDSKLVGVAAGSHAEWGAACIILWADAYKDNPDSFEKRPDQAAERYQVARDQSYFLRTTNGGCCVLM
eukprot:CAMPEP_0201545042 /NCGR_PEP_ID=MMETSP0173_2-20130828/1614_1 /ASSEMBLY_ACC=CAM_ASM_000268 /TAXON_ID=218659 /ORGANISM="Vexillifera sp., Strain DIVA3 564/2" /LENGTH=304 /DNA_ID=CAMNT_0047953349 /DNA_START=481 /DNA_END=1395 /DNA_ORIENTATION=+